MMYVTVVLWPDGGVRGVYSEPVEEVQKMFKTAHNIDISYNEISREKVQ